MRPHDFVDLAKKLAQNSTSADCRSAVSRAYYGVFHLGKELLSSWGFLFHGEGPDGSWDHKLVKDRLFYSYDNNLSIVGQRLQALHKERKRADYQLDDAAIEAPANARAVVARADRLVQLLNDAAKGPPEPRVLDAIRSWDEQNEDIVP